MPASCFDVYGLSTSIPLFLHPLTLCLHDLTLLHWSYDTIYDAICIRSPPFSSPSCTSSHYAAAASTDSTLRPLQPTLIEMEKLLVLIKPLIMDAPPDDVPQSQPNVTNPMRASLHSIPVELRLEIMKHVDIPALHALRATHGWFRANIAPSPPTYEELLKVESHSQLMIARNFYVCSAYKKLLYASHFSSLAVTGHKRRGAKYVKWRHCKTCQTLKTRQWQLFTLGVSLG